MVGGAAVGGACVGGTCGTAVLVAAGACVGGGVFVASFSRTLTFTERVSSVPSCLTTRSV